MLLVLLLTPSCFTGCARMVPGKHLTRSNTRAETSASKRCPTPWSPERCAPVPRWKGAIEMNRQLHRTVQLCFPRLVALLNPGGAEMNAEPRVRCKSVRLWNGIFRHPRKSSWSKLLSIIGLILACCRGVQSSSASGVPDSVPDGRTVIQWNLTGVTIFLQV